MSEGARRRRVKTLKQQLPYPYDQDLSPVLRNLNRRTPFGRRRQANDPVTAAYLAAAVRLIQRHLGPGVIRTPEDPEDPDSIPRPLLSFLSQRAVAAEVDHNPVPFHRIGRVSTMRERWRHQSGFIADVLRFGLWAWHDEADRAKAGAARAAEQAAAWAAGCRQGREDVLSLALALAKANCRNGLTIEKNRS